MSKRRKVHQPRPASASRPALVQAHAHDFTDVDSRLLTAVARAHRDVEASTADRTQRVLEARSAGATWVELGSVLGCSPQAVQKRYGTPTTRYVLELDPGTEASRRVESDDPADLHDFASIAERSGSTWRILRGSGGLSRAGEVVSEGGPGL